MSEDQALALTGTLGAMALVIAALLVRRLPLRTMGRLALIWVAIFAAAFLLLRLLPAIVAYFT